ncbi:cation:proton antiporter [Ensifer adhaerens]|uniref:cation:proton antiporter n=1 Tax=Ensifer adhaerens TaxID=106592 RepID=UPI001CC0F036|nr:cation:proton antiporter [Ensifer adhaerens]MBZ7920881.1 cation:proton antiporter [Ensifer adhaerens]UAX93333.1 cation:proton antiporter [Ensifer adhaerens]UAY00970.1 cation:proton antiporter [Ensifer adhaerens]UAY08351.1 cation:proton antiporter [Ensifer adhaerens]
MSLPDQIEALATGFALIALSVALLITVWRIIRGPTLPDRVLGLDMLVAIAIGLIAVVAIRTGFNLYIDIAIALGLVGFLATVAFARFILARGLSPETANAERGLAEAKRGPAPRSDAMRRKRKGGRR